MSRHIRVRFHSEMKHAVSVLHVATVGGMGSRLRPSYSIAMEEYMAIKLRPLQE